MGGTFCLRLSSLKGSTGTITFEYDDPGLDDTNCFPSMFVTLFVTLDRGAVRHRLYKDLAQRAANLR
jgi:hypothetical protein